MNLSEARNPYEFVDAYLKQGSSIFPDDVMMDFTDLWEYGLWSEDVGCAAVDLEMVLAPVVDCDEIRVFRKVSDIELTQPIQGVFANIGRYIWHESAWFGISEFDDMCAKIKAHAESSHRKSLFGKPDICFGVTTPIGKSFETEWYLVGY